MPILMLPVLIKSSFKYICIISRHNPVWQAIPVINDPVGKIEFTQFEIRTSLLHETRKQKWEFSGNTSHSSLASRRT